MYFPEINVQQWCKVKILMQNCNFSKQYVVPGLCLFPNVGASRLKLMSHSYPRRLANLRRLLQYLLVHLPFDPHNPDTVVSLFCFPKIDSNTLPHWSCVLAFINITILYPPISTPTPYLLVYYTGRTEPSVFEMSIPFQLLLFSLRDWSVFYTHARWPHSACAHYATLCEPCYSPTLVRSSEITLLSTTHALDNSGAAKLN